RPAAALLERARRDCDGGRAAPVLRRHDQGQGPAVALLRSAAALARSSADARALAVPARYRERAHQASADGGWAPQAAGSAAQVALERGLQEQDAGTTSAHSRLTPPRVASTRTQAPAGSRLCNLV